MRPDRIDSARLLRPRRPGPHPRRSPAARTPVRSPAADGVKRRRANVLFVLALTAACTVFLAATSSSPGMTYAAVGACLALAAYVVVLAQASAAGARPRRQPVSGGRRHEAVVEQAPARRQAAAAPSPRYRGERATHAPAPTRSQPPLPPAGRPRASGTSRPGPRPLTASTTAPSRSPAGHRRRPAPPRRRDTPRGRLRPPPVGHGVRRAGAVRPAPRRPAPLAPADVDGLVSRRLRSRGTDTMRAVAGL